MTQSAIPLGEQWLPVPGFDRYQVSNHGRIWSSYGNGRYLKACMLGPPGYKYPGVVLCNGPIRWQAKIHQVVMLAFVGPRPEGQEVRHLDGDPFNNRWEPGDETETRVRGGNLFYGTHARNARDMAEHGTMALAKKLGSQRLNAKFTEETIPLVRAEYAAGGVTQRALASKYGVNVRTIHCLLTRQTWKHVA